MKKQSLVSVIIPTHNRAILLKNAIQSVLLQQPQESRIKNQESRIKNQESRARYKAFDIEVLVCDDGSTDTTKEVVANFNDERVRYIDCGRNGRPSIPRNIGINNARGTWICVLDDDDSWEETKLITQLAFMKKHRIKACSTNSTAINTATNETHPYFTDIPTQKYTLADFLTVNPVMTSSMIFHRSLIKKVRAKNGFFPEDESLKAIEDYALWLRILFYTPIGYIQQPLIVYRDDSDSIRAHQPHITFDEQFSIVMKDLRNWIAEKPFFTRKRFDCILRRRLAHKKPIMQQIKTLIKRILFTVLGKN